MFKNLKITNQKTSKEKYYESCMVQTKRFTHIW